MRYEPYIIQIVKYNQTLRDKIAEWLLKRSQIGIEPADELIRDLTSESGASGAARLLNVPKELLFEELRSRIEGLIWGHSIEPQSLTSSDLGIFLDDEFLQYVATLLSTDLQQVIDELFYINELREIAEAAQVIDPEDKSVNVFARCISEAPRQRILDEAGEKDIWSLLAVSVKEEASQIIKASGRIHGHTSDVLSNLVIEYISSKESEGQNGAKEDDSQKLDFLATVKYKSWVMALAQTYTQQAIKTLEIVYQQGDNSAYSSIVYAVSLYHLDCSYRKALEVMLLPEIEEESDLLGSYVYKDQDGIRHIDPKLAQIMVLGGFEFPEADELVPESDPPALLVKSNAMFIHTPEEVANNIIENYDNGEYSTQEWDVD